MFTILRRLKRLVVQHRPTAALVFGAVVVTLVYGTAGFHFIESQPWVESFYWTITTMSTVGYGDLSPTTTLGRFHAILLMLMGIGVFGLVVEALISLMLALAERRAKGMITVKKKQHIVVCGWSESVREVIIELQKMSREVFLLADDLEVRDRLERMNVDTTFVKGDPTRFEDLERAGVKEASMVVIDLDTDSESLDALITIRDKTEARIVVEVERDENRHKFITAGADEITIPFVLSGRLIAQAGEKRFLTRFVTEVISTDVGMSLEEVPVAAQDQICGLSVAELAGKRHLPDAYVIAVGRGDELLIDTGGGLTVQAGDHLICLKQAPGHGVK